MIGSVRCVKRGSAMIASTVGCRGMAMIAICGYEPVIAAQQAVPVAFKACSRALAPIAYVSLTIYVALELGRVLPVRIPSRPIVTR
jgi:hypothetical protein